MLIIRRPLALALSFNNMYYLQNMIVNIHIERFLSEGRKLVFEISQLQKF